MPLYAWNELSSVAMNERVRRQTIHSDHMTVARVELQKDGEVPEHSHPQEQISMVDRGALRFSIEGGHTVVRAGQSLVIPPHVPHAVVALEDTVAFDVFTPPRDDWKK